MLDRTKTTRNTGAPTKMMAVSLLALIWMYYGNNGIAELQLFHKVASDTATNERLEFRPEKNIFPRAREWSEYWTNASSQEPIGDTHLHDDYVVLAAKLASDDTLDAYTLMKQRYASVRALPDFYARGIGWIQERLGLVLTAVIAGDIDTSDQVLDSANGEGPTLQAGPVTVFIVDTVGKTKCIGEGESWKDIQPPLTMWVRAYGMSPDDSGETEIFAGTALPHNLKSSTLCAWRYDFEPKNEGLYSLHVKVLTFNGFADSLASKCLERKTSELQFHATEHKMSERYLHHRGLYGFKFYGVEDGCCEACKRARNCKMFSTPGRLKLDHCELYFDQIEDDIDFLDRDNGKYLGRYRNYSYTKQDPTDFPNNGRRRLALSPDEVGLYKWWLPPDKVPGDVTYFIGCGWSATMSLEHPCHYPSDDLIFGSGVKFRVVGKSKKQEHDHTLPPCVLNDEKLDTSKGRWVRHPFPEDDSICLPMEQEISTGYWGFQPRYYGDRPYCWHVDDITKIGITCAEGDCGHLIGHRWVTDLKREAKWYGWWAPYKCQYRELGDKEVQQCINKKNIVGIETRGASIKQIIDGYLEPKLRNINMKNESSNLIVTLDTLAMPHLLWGKSIDEHVEALRNFPDVLADTEIESYFVTGFYYTSEREPHVTVDRSLQFSKLAYNVLTPKGYKSEYTAYLQLFYWIYCHVLICN